MPEYRHKKQYSGIKSLGTQMFRGDGRGIRIRTLNDGVKLSCAQFFVSGIISVILMFIFEKPSIHAIMSAAPYLLYTGILSCGVAFTFQTLGQRDSDPTVASLLLCLESVFAVIFAWVLIDQKMSVRELSGCIIMFVAIVLAQLPADVFKRKKKV